jgi:hypothetical protein
LRKLKITQIEEEIEKLENTKAPGIESIRAEPPEAWQSRTYLTVKEVT